MMKKVIRKNKEKKQFKNLKLPNLFITKFRRNWLHLLKKKKEFFEKFGKEFLQLKKGKEKNQDKKEFIDNQKKDKVEDIRR